MPKQNTEPSSDPTLTEIKMFPRKLFYAHYAIRILEEDDDKIFEEKNDSFIKEWIDTVFDIYNAGKLEECYFYYNAPLEILRPMQASMIESVVIDGREGARTTHKRISTFCERYIGYLAYRARKEDIEEELYNCLDGKSIDITYIPEVVDSNKLNWTGTPGEFGAIMKELIDKGYLPKIKDLKTTVNILYKFFEVKNGDDKIVNEKYLYKCFGEKMKKYNYKNELQIPLSDNYNRNK